MRLQYIAGFLVYLVLSLMIILPVQVSAFNATVTGNAGIPDVRGELDVTSIEILAQSPVSIQATDGQNYQMDCTQQEGYFCSYMFSENTLSPGVHQLVLHQELGEPQTINKRFYVDNQAPEVYNEQITIINTTVANTTRKAIKVEFQAQDPQATSEEESCAGIQEVSITTQTNTLYETQLPRTCNLYFNQTIYPTNTEGNLTLVLTVTDALGQITIKELPSIEVDFKEPQLPDTFATLVAGEELEQIAERPQLFPVVDLEVIITETSLQTVFIDASELTANPAKYPLYEQLPATCTQQADKNRCVVTGLELNPSKPIINITVQALDASGNYVEKELTKTFEVVEALGEVVRLNPSEEHCLEDTCHIKKGANKIYMQVLHEQELLPGLLTLGIGDLNPLGAMKATSCEEQGLGTYQCIFNVPAIIDQTNTPKRLTLTTPTTDSVGNALKGISSTTVILDTDKPEITSDILLTETCPTAGMTTTINLTARDETTPQLTIKALTNATTGGYNFTQTCNKENQEFTCQVQLQNFVNYPEQENITIIITDLAGNEAKQEIELSVCQSESNVAPETIRRVSAITEQKVNKRIASYMPARVFVPITFSLQSAVASKTEILGIDHDECVNTEFLGDVPYFLNEDVFVRNQEDGTTRGELILIVPIGGQAILEDEIEINCNISVYERVGETRYTLPEVENIKLTVQTYNNPLGTISDTTNDRLEEIVSDLKGIDDSIKKKMKIHKLQETLCMLSDTLGKITSAISTVETVLYAIVVVLQATVAKDTSGKFWKGVCELFEKFGKFKKGLWKSNTSNSFGNLKSLRSGATQILKVGCTLYNCGFCTVDGLMMVANVAVSATKFAQSDANKAKRAEQEGMQTAEEQKLLDDVIKTKEQLNIKEAEYDTLQAQAKSQIANALAQEQFSPIKETKSKETNIITVADLNSKKAEVEQLQNVQLKNKYEKYENYFSSKDYVSNKAGLYNQYVGDSLKDSMDEAQRSSQWIIDPYKNKAYAGICLCNPGQIHALHKERQLKCRQYTCIKNAAEQGLPISECDKNYEVASCLYVEGAATKRTFFGELWQGIKNSLLAEPVKTVRMAICYSDYLPVSQGFQMGGSAADQACSDQPIKDWRTPFCAATDAYLQVKGLVNMMKNVFEGSRDQLEPEGPDYCAEVSIT